MNPTTVSQIAVSSGEDADLLYTLCTDGSIWVCRTTWTGKDGNWTLIPPPQPEPQKPQN